MRSNKMMSTYGIPAYCAKTKVNRFKIIKIKKILLTNNGKDSVSKLYFTFALLILTSFKTSENVILYKKAI